jgi:hypothetical protein
MNLFRLSGFLLLLLTLSLVGTFLPNGIADEPSDKTSREIVKLHGEAGQRILHVFGSAAVSLYQRDKKTFIKLVDMARQPQSSLRRDPTWKLLTRPWKPAVHAWTKSGKLGPFLERLNKTPREKLAIALKVPAALPLLCLKETPTAHKMLDHHGEKAWRLFVAFDFQQHPEDVERVARALEEHDKEMLDLLDDFGPQFALLFVNPDSSKGSRQMPVIVRHALSRLERPVALALVTACYQDVAELLDDGTSVKRVLAAIDLFRTQSAVVQEFNRAGCWRRSTCSEPNPRSCRNWPDCCMSATPTQSVGLSRLSPSLAGANPFVDCLRMTPRNASSTGYSIACIRFSAGRVGLRWSPLPWGASQTAAARRKST